MSGTGSAAPLPRKFKVRELSQVLVGKCFGRFGSGCFVEDDCPLETCLVFVTVIDGTKRVFRGAVQADSDFVHHGAPTDLLGIVLLDEATGAQLFPPVS